MTEIADLEARLRSLAKTEHSDMSVAEEAADMIKELAGALEGIVMAHELPGDHCELEDAVRHARKLIGYDDARD